MRAAAQHHGHEPAEGRLRDLDDFVAWFAGSAAVDPSGLPLVLCHLTDADFDRFGQTKDIGFHFGSAEQANDRGDSLGADHRRATRPLRVLPVVLAVRRPFVLRNDPQSWNADYVISCMEFQIGRERAGRLRAIEAANLAAAQEEHAAKGGGDAAWHRVWVAWNAKTLAAVRRELEAMGHDGMVYPNLYEAADMRRAPEFSWVAFRPGQVRSIFAKGSWHPLDDDPRLRPGWAAGRNPTAAVFSADRRDPVMPPYRSTPRLPKATVQLFHDSCVAALESQGFETRERGSRWDGPVARLERGSDGARAEVTTMRVDLGGKRLRWDTGVRLSEFTEWVGREAAGAAPGLPAPH